MYFSHFFFKKKGHQNFLISLKYLLFFYFVSTNGEDVKKNYLGGQALHVDLCEEVFAVETQF